MDLAAFTVIILALIVERYLHGRSARQERDGLLTQMEADRLAALHERSAIAEAATDERRELLTRITHPQLLVTRDEPQQAVVEPEDDDWAKVGTVLDPVPVDESEPED